MWKRILPILVAPLLLSGCAATFTNLTPHRQPRNTENAYAVEVALDTRQQSLKWESIQPYVNVGTEFFPMRQTQLMKNRWEGLVPVPPGTNLVYYRYKFDFQYRDFGGLRADSATSPEYKLVITDK